MKATHQILLRTDKSLHQSLLQEAKSSQQSLNELCVQRLSLPHSLEGKEKVLLREVVSAAVGLYQKSLKGILFYGSRARGTATQTSDWDFLFVLDTDQTLNRNLYRVWDDAYPHFASQNIEIHFAILPDRTSIATGFWGELALDALVLFERDFEVSRHLHRIRREIAEGVIVRHVTHGQAYWIHREVV